MRLHHLFKLFSYRRALYSDNIKRRKITIAFAILFNKPFHNGSSHNIFQREHPEIWSKEINAQWNRSRTGATSDLQTSSPRRMPRSPKGDTWRCPTLGCFNAQGGHLQLCWDPLLRPPHESHVHGLSTGAGWRGRSCSPRFVQHLAGSHNWDRFAPLTRADKEEEYRKTSSHPIMLYFCIISQQSL